MVFKIGKLSLYYAIMEKLCEEKTEAMVHLFRVSAVLTTG